MQIKTQDAQQMGFKKLGMEGGEMVQQLRSPAILAEALDLFPSTHMAVHSHVSITPVPGGLMPFSDLLGLLHKCSAYYIHPGMHIYT